MSHLVKRETYLRKIRPLIGKPLIKVITGIRRCGKSTMFTQIIDELIESGVQGDKIIRMNLDDLQYLNLREAVPLYEYISELIKDGSYYYVFLDEIQNVNGWENTVNSILLKENADIYISGSNSRLLSSELATFIAGRYVAVEIHTLSLKEFAEFRKKYQPHTENERSLLDDYIHTGGFPMASRGDFDAATVKNIVNDIYQTVFLKDAVTRNKVRNSQKLERFLMFMFDNIGNPFSARMISREFEKNDMNLDVNTIIKYLDYLESAYILRRAQRYEMRGKRIIGSEDKYYVSEISLIYPLIGYKSGMISGIEENIIYSELIRRDYSVNVGRTYDGKEIDFVAEKDGKKVYVQVSHRISSEEAVEREFRALEGIKDNYPKYVVVSEGRWPLDRGGIQQISLVDFLLSDSL